MASRLASLIDLLHAPGDIALATNSAAMPGYPYATSIAFATDEHHRPVFLISRLAEHTQNLMADARASLMVARTLGDGEIARASLLGSAAPFDASPLFIKRYLRFHPEAELFLQLGDFQFYRFDPVRIRVVGGFAQAGWLDGKQLLDAPSISLEEEARLVDEAKTTMPDSHVILGVDAYGADYLADGSRQRAIFKTGPVTADSIDTVLAQVFSTP
jgi:putative heme iron utilization protein